MALIKKFRIKSYKTIKSIIEFENVTLAYGNRIILDNISFKINEGQIFGMLGPNGVGKSTIFNLITGLINPDTEKLKLMEKMYQLRFIWELRNFKLDMFHNMVDF